MSLADPSPLVDTPDADEQARLRARRIERIGKWSLPVIVMALGIFLWDRIVVWNEIPHYILPGPGRVLDTLIADWGILYEASLLTARTTILALLLAVIGGAGLAILFNQSKMVEMSFYPYAVILQVTPVVSIAPLIFIYVDSKTAGMLLCAWIVAFFPVLSSTTLGLNSVDHNLRDLFRIYGATRWQKLWMLQLPSALPYFLGGLKIAGGLSLIGAVVAELVAGTGGVGAGLAARIQEAGYRLNIARMFAALSLVAAMGVFIFAALSVLSHMLLHKWHESALTREG
ncbi:binding-protein-dependent transport systems inner membrane component [Dinoroseobacter shibae DFL 12 = DSM 16493]|jgi:NitT/TauT family transport system permease protein|uniref:Binding-protein-dependent transport systems inner membrane component n=1 Tax=Dinoroseobacter shibae (strain DSM 16493 / NCIMB 14021 / DFL 12) TaxID=398580 RepID=A8LJA2_DINSH|nr:MULTISPECIES: ABC transporter permease [Dinoroseobacter]ABV93124.1 binding-protein-dependent transport systems inner membrane component [Dinoroseobacter shibae DFL 12 = DSM 16493]MDD9716226.1 ABC transporter permease [Dinoroseobacter sp. PD6]URF48051.1 ABC transporter permease [Dinoroseobacter shibae]URF52361.1 ABC transporter permease [Dinoroseobacter shibae]